jgi:hypothetical protein
MLHDKNVQHPNLDTASQIPQSLAKYDFIFLDSVNKLGLQPEYLTRLKAQYPGKSFIYVFQSTKDGNFRGENSFQHDVDAVIEVPEKGKAVQFGRFNQGGKFRFFSNFTLDRVYRGWPVLRLAFFIYVSQRIFINIF